jgi:hypothetical protein
VLLKRVYCANGQHRQKVKREVGGAEVFEHVAPQCKGQALSTVFGRCCNGVPALFDIVIIRLVEALRQPHHAVLELRAFQVADPVERCPLASRECPDPVDDRRDHVRLGGGEALGPCELADPGADLQREQLIGGGGTIHGDVFLFRALMRCRARI